MHFKEVSNYYIPSLYYQPSVKRMVQQLVHEGWPDKDFTLAKKIDVYSSKKKKRYAMKQPDVFPVEMSKYHLLNLCISISWNRGKGSMKAWEGVWHNFPFRPLKDLKWNSPHGPMLRQKVSFLQHCIQNIIVSLICGGLDWVILYRTWEWSRIIWGIVIEN